MDFNEYVFGFAWRVFYAPRTKRGEVWVADRDESLHAFTDGAPAPTRARFTYAFGDASVAWTDPLPRPHEAQDCGERVARWLFAQEPLATVSCAADGWTTFTRPNGFDIPRTRASVTHNLENDHVYPLPIFTAKALAAGVELVVCERVYDERSGLLHPMTRSRLLGLDRRLCGTLAIVARKNGVAVSVPDDLLQPLVKALDAMPPQESALQALRHVLALREDKQALAHDLQRAEWFLWDEAARLAEVMGKGLSVAPAKPKAR